MASGNRRLRINTQERAVSSDINRLQQFQNQDFGEFLRLLLNVGTDDDDPGTVTESTTLDTPLGAEVVNGLLVRPVAGNFSLTVDPGILTALAPDAAVDDSNYKYVRDPGIPSAGTLAITANSSGSIRIDVIECRVNPVEATVSDSRDIFDPSSGLFSATSVTKELRGQLEFRVRAGTGGSGYPTAQNGWLPLCVASVPDSVASNDGITFWDVRPMIADRAHGPMNDKLANRVLDVDYQLRRADATHANVEGTFHAVLEGRRVGGSYLNSVPGTSAILNIAAAANQDTGTIAEPLPAQQLVFIYVATPFGLPRWARYTDGPSGRVPGAQKGLLIVSQTAAGYDGAPVTAIALPSGTGLLGTTSTAICVGLGADDNGGGFNEGYGSQKTISFTTALLVAGAYAVLAPGSVDFHVTDVQWPKFAKSMLVHMQVQITVNGGATASTSNDIFVWSDDAGAGTVLIYEQTPDINFNHTGAPVAYFFMSGETKLELPAQKPGSSTPLASPRYIQWDLTNTGLSAANMFMSIDAYELR